MLFYVVILKTDTPNKPFAVHLTKLKKKFRQKAVFKFFMKEHSSNPKEYHVESLTKNDKPRNFYSKKAAVAMCQKLSLEHGYYVRNTGNTWSPFEKPETSRKPPQKNKEFIVRPIPTLELQAFVEESRDVDSPIDAAAKLMFARGIPVFSMKTRKFGISTLFKYSIRMKNLIWGNMIDALDKRRKLKKYDYGYTRLQHDTDKIADWDSFFFQKKKTINLICGALSRLYKVDPGSREHTQDAIEPANNILVV